MFEFCDGILIGWSLVRHARTHQIKYHTSDWKKIAIKNTNISTNTNTITDTNVDGLRWEDVEAAEP